MKVLIKYKKKRPHILRKRKLGLFTELYLNSRGKKDYQKGIVRKKSEDQYLSPFIIQEISLTLATIKKEKEYLTEILLLLQIEMNNAQKTIEIKHKEADEVEEQIENINVDTTNIRYAGEEIELLSDDTIVAYRESERNIYLSLKEKELSQINESTIIYSSEIQNYNKKMDKERKITNLRCQQLYDILVARLSAYWAGVLSNENSVQDVPPNLQIDDLLYEVKQQCQFVD